MKKFISIMMSLAMMATMCTVVLAKPSISEPDALDNVLGKVLGLVSVIGYTFAFGMLLYVGIKYVMASANEKADLKKGSISYVIGAIIIFGASALMDVFSDLSEDIVGS